jgi:hypothetical protein
MFIAMHWRGGASNPKLNKNLEQIKKLHHHYLAANHKEANKNGDKNKKH